MVVAVRTTSSSYDDHNSQPHQRCTRVHCDTYYIYTMQNTCLLPRRRQRLFRLYHQWSSLSLLLISVVVFVCTRIIIVLPVSIVLHLSLLLQLPIYDYSVVYSFSVTTSTTSNMILIQPHSKMVLPYTGNRYNLYQRHPQIRRRRRYPRCCYTRMMFHRIDSDSDAEDNIN